MIYITNTHLSGAILALAICLFILAYVIWRMIARSKPPGHKMPDGLDWKLKVSKDDW
jgi:hypothetical protein